MNSRLFATGLGLAGLAALAGYHTMSPTSQLYGRTFTGLDPDSRLLALTYDDGPNDPYTWHMLEALQRHNVHATFFLVGRFVQQKPAITRAIVEAGHAIGNHTWDHPKLIFKSAADVRRQLAQTQLAILDATGIQPKLFRPPFGGHRPSTLRVARQLSLSTIMWGVTCYDWKAHSANEIVRHAEKQIRGGSVILLHDGEYHRMGGNRSRSVAATEIILARYQAEGYRFATIPEMMQTRTAGTGE